MKDDLVIIDGDKMSINQCRHCKISFFSRKWLDYHLVWNHKGDGY